MSFTSRPSRRFALAVAASVLLGSAGAVVAVTPAHAATYTVTSLANSGAGSLREAIGFANASVGVADTIEFSGALSSSTLLIDSVLLITDALTITGLGSGSLSIQRTAGPTSDVFAFQPGTANQDFSLSGITVQGDNVITGSGVVANDNVETPRNVSVVDVTFTDMVNSVIGGPAIIVDTIAGILSVDDSRFFGNTGGASGGAISAVDVGTAITIINSEFIGNEATGDGGAIYVDSPAASVDITSTDFELNKALVSGAGGAVLILRATGVTMTGASFEDNTSYNAGGGAYVSAATFVTVTDSVFFLNETTSNRGGGLYAGISGLVTITNVQFSNNTANIAGGGFATLSQPDVVVQNSRFTDNFSGGGAGGMYFAPTASSVSIERTTFEDNEATTFGGGVYVESLSTGGAFSVHSSTFFANEAASGGNALAVADIDGEATIVNSTIDEAEIAVVATVLGGELRLRYSTLLGGLVVLDNQNTVEVVSSILDGLTAPAIDIGVGGAPAGVSYSLLSSAHNPAFVTNGAGNQFSVANMKLGPLQNNGGPTFTRMPLAGSPAIDKGLPGGTPPTFDQRFTGFPRVLGGRVDIGAVEAPAVLPATGDELNPWIPIAAGVLILGGIAAVVISGVRRRRNG